MRNRETWCTGASGANEEKVGTVTQGSKTGTKPALALLGLPCSWLGNKNMLFTQSTTPTSGQSRRSVASPRIPGRGRTGPVAGGVRKGAVNLEMVSFAIPASPSEWPAALTLVPGEAESRPQTRLLAGR